MKLFFGFLQGLCIKLFFVFFHTCLDSIFIKYSVVCKYWEKNTIGDKVEKFRGECKKRSSRQCWSSQPVSGTKTPECQNPTFLAFLTAAVRVENMYGSFSLDSGGKHVWELSPWSLWLSCSRALAPSLAQADESWRLLRQNSLLYLPGSQNSSQEHPAISLASSVP